MEPSSVAYACQNTNGNMIIISVDWTTLKLVIKPSPVMHNAGMQFVQNIEDISHKGRNISLFLQEYVNPMESAVIGSDYIILPVDIRIGQCLYLRIRTTEISHAYIMNDHMILSAPNHIVNVDMTTGRTNVDARERTFASTTLGPYVLYAKRRDDLIACELHDMRTGDQYEISTSKFDIITGTQRAILIAPGLTIGEE